MIDSGAGRAPARPVAIFLLLLLVLLAAGLPVARAAEIVLAADLVTLNDPIPASASLTRIDFRRTYSAPPLVFVLGDSSNPSPAEVRITNVTTTGFDAGVFETPGEDGIHPSVQFAYVAVSPGTYSVGGQALEAGTLSTSAFQARLVSGSSWQPLGFANTYASPATLLLGVQGSQNGTLTAGTVASPWLTTAASNVSGSGADVALERAETSNGSVSSAENVGYLALASGTTASFSANGNTIVMEAIRSADNVTGWDNGCTTVPFAGSYPDPVAVAHQATRDGNNGGWLRSCAGGAGSVGVTVEEDRSNDSERSHTTEVASVLVFSQPFDAALPGGRGWEAAAASVTANTGASLSFTPVLFARAFTSMPLVFTQALESGADPATVRVRAVTPSGFEVAAVEPPGSNGAPESMTIHYVAAVPGRHVLDDGAEFEAGFVDTTTVQRSSVVGGPQGWDTITFSQPFPAPPALLAQIQTTSNSNPAPDPAAPFTPWLNVAVSALTAASVDVALERSEVSSGSVSAAERIGYLAMASDRRSTLTDIDNTAIAYDTRVAPGLVQGYDNGCFAVAFNSSFAATPLAVSHMATRAGGDGGWLRRCGLTPGAISVHVDEDVSNDTERAHITETVSVIAFAEPFQWRPFPDLTLATSLIAISDPTGTGDPKSLPGAVLEYQVQVNNTGRGSSDSDSVQIEDAVPAGTELFVGDLDGTGYPVVFVDGSPPDGSGLSFDPATDLSFSSNGGTDFTYVPAGGVDWDPAVTHLRVNPRGSFAGAAAGTAPVFTVRYRVRVR